MGILHTTWQSQAIAMAATVYALNLKHVGAAIPMLLPRYGCDPTNAGLR